jgi:GNAT superfamily N-acetyltransferase
MDAAPSRPAFRRARADDVPAIVAMLADDELGRGREDASLPLDPRYLVAFDEIDADPRELLAVAEADGEVVGCLQLTFLRGLSNLGALRGQIEGVRIASSRRGTGIGAAFVRWAVEECRARGCTVVQLTTDKRRADAHRFYGRLGFAASHEGMKLRL